MAVAQILDENLEYIHERFITSDTITKKVNLGDGLEVKEDGKIHALNADTVQNNKIQELENRIQELENYIDLLKQSYTIILDNGEEV
jgi:hypothetical protein